MLTIVARVVIDEDGCCAELLGTLDLETAEDASVAGEDDLAGEIDAFLDEGFVVLHEIINMQPSAGIYDHLPPACRTQQR